MTTKNNNNYWKYYAIFIVCYFGFFGIILPIIDELLLGFAYRHFLCEYNLLLPLESSKEFCSK